MAYSHRVVVYEKEASHGEYPLYFKDTSELIFSDRESV